MSNAAKTQPNAVASVLAKLSGACRKLVDQFDAFWMLAGLTDYSFEEGVRNAGYRTAIARYSDREIPIPVAVQDELQRGINGNLHAVLEEDPTMRDGVIRNVGKGQDLLIAVNGRQLARVEVKLVYDCTLPKYYPSVAADMQKLFEVRQGGCAEELFLVTFFVQFPNYVYPPNEGVRGVFRKGIAAQFAELQKHLPLPPVWPEQAPHIHFLRPPSDARVLNVMMEVLSDRYKAMPKSLTEQLRDAAVGTAIWCCVQ